MLPPAEQVGILNRRGVDKPGVWRESLNFPAHQSRLGEETTRGELATPEATHVQPRNNFHLMPAVSETGQHVGDEHATPRGVFFTAGTTLKVGCTLWIYLPRSLANRQAAGGAIRRWPCVRLPSLAIR